MRFARAVGLAISLTVANPRRLTPIMELCPAWVVFFTPMVGCAGNFQEEPFMKRTFLISTATAALVAGTVLAAAQGAQKQAPSAGAADRGGASQSETQRGSDRS